MKPKTRWELVLFDSLIYLASAMLILVVYPSNITEITTEQVIIFTLVGWVLVTGIRMFFHIYRKIWRYAGQNDYIMMILADGIAASLFLLFRALIPEVVTFVRAVSLFTLNLLGCIIVRLIYQNIYQARAKDSRTERVSLWLLKHLTGVDFGDETNNPNRIKIAIIGAGSVGTMLAEELLQNPRATYQPVCFVDVDEGKVGREVYGVPVLDSSDGLEAVLQDKGVQEVVFALPNVPSGKREELYQYYRGMGYKIKAYDTPVLGERAKLHDFNIEDLLFRTPEEFLTEETKEYYRRKNVMITGGGGSIGSELARQIAKCEPARLVLLDVYENGAYDIQQELLRRYPDLNIRIEIMSVCNREMLDRVFELHTPDIVLHAAAHKHVPLMERNVCEAVVNNVFGTLNVVNACEKYGVGRFIMVSTDKAVNPTNVMGATKRMCEMLVLSRANSNKNTVTKFSATRFGNVLGSNGSVIPLFEKQIEAGGPVTVTDRRIIRYFMTIPEATQLVMTSGAMAKNGELYVLDMGKPVKIIDLAENMVRLSGLEPGKDIEIVETGLRPGEKMYEELLVRGEELSKTENEKIFIEKDTPLTEAEIDEKLGILRHALETRSNRAVKQALKEVVPTFRNSQETGRNNECSTVKEEREKQMTGTDK